MRRFLAVWTGNFFLFSDPTVPSASPSPSHRWVKLPTFLNAESWRNWTPRNHVPLPPWSKCRTVFQPCPLKGLRKKGSRIPLNLAAGILGSSQLMLVSFFNQVIYTSASNALPKTRISLSNTNFILLATWVLDMLDNPNCHDAELWDSSSPDAGARAAMQAVDISSNWTYHRSARKP